MRVDDRIRRLIGENASEDDIVRTAFAEAHTLAKAARAAVLKGVTTVEEALRVTRQEMADHGDI